MRTRLGGRDIRPYALIAGSVLLAVGLGSAGMVVAGALGGSEDTSAALVPASAASSPPATAAPSPTSSGPDVTKSREPERAPVKTRTKTITETARVLVPVGGDEDDKSSAKDDDSGTKAGSGDKSDTPAKKSPKKAAAPTVSPVGVIHNEATGMCVDLGYYEAAGAGTRVEQFECRPGESDNQMYETVSRGGAAFLVRNVKSGLCLDAPGTGASDSAVGVTVETCRLGSEDNQMFQKQAQGSGFYLKNVKSGMCLDVSDENGNQRPNQALTLYPCTPDNDHVWTFQ